MSEPHKQRVLVLYGGENAPLPRAELIAWLATTKSLHVEPLIVADDVPHSQGSVHDRVTNVIRQADKAIAVVTLDGRSKSGAPNVIEEIGRWLQGKSSRTLCVVRQEGVEVNSNLQGHVYLVFKERIKEVFEGIRTFLADEVEEASPAQAASASTSFTVEANTTNVMLDRSHVRFAHR